LRSRWPLQRQVVKVGYCSKSRGRTMHVKLRLAINAKGPDSASEDAKNKFWEDFRRVGGNTESDYSLDQNLRLRFPRLLEVQINRDLHSSQSELFRALPFRFGPRIRIKVVNVSYGSIEFLLNILGITNETIQRQVLDALIAFAPVAFNETFNSDVSLEPQTQVVSGSIEGKMRTSGTLWALMNGSLLIPIGLTLYVLYVTFNALEVEKSELKKERSELFAAIAKQNAELSVAIVNQSKNLGESARAMQNLQSYLVQQLSDKLEFESQKVSSDAQPAASDKK
jgi:hypothetical protein